jgi:hypothetical protein
MVRRRTMPNPFRQTFQGRLIEIEYVDGTIKTLHAEDKTGNKIKIEILIPETGLEPIATNFDGPYAIAQPKEQPTIKISKQSAIEINITH